MSEQILHEIRRTPELERQLLAALREYRTFAARPPMDSPYAVEQAIKNERDLARNTLVQIFRILERGQSPAIDCEILDSMARLQTTVANAPALNRYTPKTSEP